ncbi:hypothetical protein C8F04DRAFT_1268947 [Mycena alexandri]|uniref:Uncharacterized protein n=1 Tax=Mycena alexandri TaxID=1745969 RepID=A0AAD6SD13_9AGAR|nr:hypothetical protein C8F04DRAFT_1268947 [Mycena alexandri]
MAATAFLDPLLYRSFVPRAQSPRCTPASGLAALATALPRCSRMASGQQPKAARALNMNKCVPTHALRPCHLNANTLAVSSLHDSGD